jgi:hypothetical protein
VTRTAAITTPAVAPVTPPLRTPLLDPRGLNSQLPPAVRSTELLNRLNRVLLSYTSVSFGNSLRVNVLSYCFNRQATKPSARLERPKNLIKSITKGGYFALRKSATGLWHGKLVALSLGLCFGNGFPVFAEALDVVLFTLSAINSIISFRSGWGRFSCVNARGLNS